ncbi:MAG: RNA polymerase subunit sigma, partial [Lachnospiraceae bacterium]|nr:RNA polymerase subunit sigma [Lachnospiraceae bacterium]
MRDIDDIYRKYFDDVFKYLRGLTADETLSEELTQETFFKAMKS